MKYTILLAALALIGDASAIQKSGIIYHNGGKTNDPQTDSVDPK